MVCLCKRLPFSAFYNRNLPVRNTTADVPRKITICFLPTLICKITCFITVVTNLAWKGCHLHLQSISRETMRFFMTNARLQMLHRRLLLLSLDWKALSNFSFADDNAHSSSVPISAAFAVRDGFLDRTTVWILSLANPWMKKAFHNWETNFVIPHISEEVASSIAASLKYEAHPSSLLSHVATLSCFAWWALNIAQTKKS